MWANDVLQAQCLEHVVRQCQTEGAMTVQLMTGWIAQCCRTLSLQACVDDNAHVSISVKSLLAQTYTVYNVRTCEALWLLHNVSPSDWSDVSSHHRCFHVVTQYLQ